MKLTNEEVQEIVFGYIKYNNKFLIGREELLKHIKEDYIMGVIVERL